MADKHDLSDIDRRMQGALGALSEEFSGIRTGRATSGMLDRLSVSAYGGKMPIQQVASVTAPDARTLNIQVWDASIASDVERSIISSNLGFNPTREGASIRINIPPLTEDRRKELVKHAHAQAENAKIAIRNVRRDGLESIKRLEKSSEFSEDEASKLSESVQKLTDRFVRDVDDRLKAKESEILAI